MSERTRFQQVDALFAAALAQPTAERAVFLRAACDGDEELRGEVERLLAADAEAGAFLVEPAAAPTGSGAGDPTSTTTPPTHLGPYRLLREIGSGGMGTVYLARRDDDAYERDVAVKVMRAGIGSGEAVHRFLDERRILARLEHPGIARLYDGGTTEDGRPFLVMELIDGLPIDEYCDTHRLDVEARLQLFRRVCAAVQHAHQNLLVHRDLKPANILVTAGGEPKLLDFGIAKRLGPARAVALTRTGARVMTTSCASPEQVRGEPITTASDVYSLGVLLYELLAGRSPYRLSGGLPHEIEAAICDQEAEPPSRALLRSGAAEPAADAAAQARATSPAALRRRLRGDLDTIVLTGLHKAPARRYGSVAALAADVERHLEHLPVSARADSFLYRSRKLLRRHRAAAAAGALAAIVAVAFLVREVRQQRSVAQERDKARHTLSFLVDTFREADPYHARGARVTAEEILAHGEQRVSHQLAGQPDVQAAVMDAMGKVRLGLGQADAAAPLLARALQLRRRSTATARAELAESLEHLAEARRKQSRFAESETLLREAVALRRRDRSAPLPLARALNDLAVAIRSRQPTAEVGSLLREALALARSAGPDSAATVATIHFEMGLLARDEGDYARAERLFRQGLAIQRTVLGPRDPQALSDQGSLATILLDAGKPREAEALLLENLAQQRQALGAAHPHLIDVLSNLGLARHNQGDYDGAVAAYTEALALPRSSTGELDLDRALVMGNLATTMQAQTRFDESAAMFHEALEIRRRILGDRHPLVAQIQLHLARAQRLRGHLPEGLALAMAALASVEAAEGPNHPHVAFVEREIGRNLMEQGDPAAAEPHLRRAVELRKALAADSPELATAQVSLALCLYALGRDAEAEPLLSRARTTLVKGFGADDPRVQDADKQLAQVLHDRKPRR